MCTAVTYKTKDHYFGRNLDLEYSYQETVTVTPRNYAFHFRKMGKILSHYAIIGMAYVSKNYPLYYDAINEKGLCIAGLNFPENAGYKPYCDGKDNVTPFELIPWLLGQCATVVDAEKLIRTINLLDENFSDELPLSPLHWLISDKERSITLESVKSGIKIYENPVGILTNNPTFDYQLFNLNNYMQLTKGTPKNSFTNDENLELEKYSRGMGAIGLPGDASSMSRFVKASFVKLNSVSSDSEEESVSQFFHILKSVEMPRGCVELAKDVYEITHYSSCCNIDRGIYYYTTYDNAQICAVDMYKENLEGYELISYPLMKKQNIMYQN
ncbi:MAG: choloylglycine hydrolase family protein [Ruminococcaceae bacterium]|nr:choloylglycine hydrolase family protein [Oscillospiraceae bacterium]